MFAPPPKEYKYSIGTAIVLDCTADGHGLGMLSAVAPLNPNAANSATVAMSDLVVGGSAFMRP